MKSSMKNQCCIQLSDLVKSDDIVNTKSVDAMATLINNEIPQPPRPSSSLLHPDEVLEELLSTSWSQNAEENASDKNCLHCEICGKTFDKIMKYYGHLRVHSKDNLWSCDKYPNIKFATKQKLQKHKLKHDPPLRSMACMYCPLAFSTHGRLKAHFLAKHFNYRPHGCDKCDKHFLKPSDLKVHQKIHSGENKYPCLYCNMRFKDKSNLNRHVLTHTGEKPYACNICGNRFKQLASLKRHNKNCALKKLPNEQIPKPMPLNTSLVRQNHCRICGMTFQYKSALLEHSVRQHTPTTKPIEEMESRTDENKTDTLDNMLSVNDSYCNTTPSTNHSEHLTAPLEEAPAEPQTDNNDNNMLQIEFLKEINQLQYLDDELFSNDNDMDFDNFQTNQEFGMNSHDYDYVNTDENNAGIFFDFSDINKTMDQDIMNALLQGKTKDLPDDLLNMTDNTAKETDKPEPVKCDNTNSETTVSVNECATIFESDVDLEESTKLAANLNQLIGENNVQYIFTEHDDTFIISLDSHIDAAQLTDMLNIGIENKDQAEAESNEPPVEVKENTDDQNVKTSKKEQKRTNSMKEDQKEITKHQRNKQKKECAKTPRTNNNNKDHPKGRNKDSKKDYSKERQRTHKKEDAKDQRKEYIKEQLKEYIKEEPRVHKNDQLKDYKKESHNQYPKDLRKNKLKDRRDHFIDYTKEGSRAHKLYKEHDTNNLRKDNSRDQQKEYLKEQLKEYIKEEPRDYIKYQRRDYNRDYEKKDNFIDYTKEGSRAHKLYKEHDTNNLRKDNSRDQRKEYLKEQLKEYIKEEPRDYIEYQRRDYNRDYEKKDYLEQLKEYIKQRPNLFKKEQISTKKLPINKLPKSNIVNNQCYTNGLYICKTCKKCFNKKDNYRSHLAVHEPSLRRHACEVCYKRFSYKSTLNKHVKKMHSPGVTQAHNCSQCNKSYKAAWLLKNHVERDHDKLMPFSCDVPECGKRFYKKFDLIIHKRYHDGEQPYHCDICFKTFYTVSHHTRHIRDADCTKRANRILMFKNLSEITKIKPEKIIYCNVK